MIETIVAKTILPIIVIVICIWSFCQHTPLSPCPHKENRLCSHRRKPDGTCPIKDECLNRELNRKTDE